MCSMFVIFESAFSIMTQLKSDTNRMADETCMRLPTAECKADIDFITKTRNKVFFLLVSCASFSSRKSLF